MEDGGGKTGKDVCVCGGGGGVWGGMPQRARRVGEEGGRDRTQAHAWGVGVQCDAFLCVVVEISHGNGLWIEGGGGAQHPPMECW